MYEAECFILLHSAAFERQCSVCKKTTFCYIKSKPNECIGTTWVINF